MPRYCQNYETIQLRLMLLTFEHRCPITDLLFIL